MPLVRRLAKAFLAPIRRILDPRFHDVAHRIHLTRQDLSNVRQDLLGIRDGMSNVGSAVVSAGGDVDTRLRNASVSQVEAVTMVGQEMRATQTGVAAIDESVVQLRENIVLLHEEVRSLSSQLDLHRTEMGALTRSEHVASWVRQVADLAEHGTPADIDGAAAQLLNFGASHLGFAAQANLWMNPPLVIEHVPGDVHLSVVNERIVEVPFAMRALGDVPLGGKILDFGSAESTVSFSLATMGFEVTALDLRMYPFAHANLTALATPLEAFDAEPGSFDAILVISTVEHVGLGWYGEQPGRYDDLRAMARLRELLVPGGTLVLTVPYGSPSIDALQRRYDGPGLDGLLEGFEVQERIVIERTDDVHWQTVPDSSEHAVALVKARTGQS